MCQPQGIIEIDGQLYEFRTVGCLYGLYEVEKGLFEDGQKVPGADLAPRQFSFYEVRRTEQNGDEISQ